jgi:bacteriorhodopsin
MDMSYQEKSILGSLLAMVVVYGYYFTSALRHLDQSAFDGGSIGRLLFTVIAIVVIEIVYHIVLAIESKPEPKDERDLLIEGKAYRNAYFVVATGAALVIGYVIVVTLVRDAAPTRIVATPFLLVNAMLLFMVLAELMKLATQLLFYRKGF